jgi:hypothetical protein
MPFSLPYHPWHVALIWQPTTYVMGAILPCWLTDLPSFAQFRPYSQFRLTLGTILSIIKNRLGKKSANQKLRIFWKNWKKIGFKKNHKKFRKKDKCYYFLKFKVISIA